MSVWLWRANVVSTHIIILMGLFSASGERRELVTIHQGRVAALLTAQISCRAKGGCGNTLATLI